MTHLPVYLAVAIAFGAAFGVAWPQVLMLALATAVAAWTGAVAAWRTGRHPAVLPLALAGIVSVAAALGGLAHAAVVRPPLVSMLEEAGALADDAPPAAAAVRLEGTLIADAAPIARGVLLRLQAQRVWTGPCECPQVTSGGVVVTVAGDLAQGRAPEWRAGRRVRLTAAVRPPRLFRNRGSPDARADLVRRRAALVATVKSALLVELVARGPLMSEAAGAVRARARAALRRAAGPGGGEAAAVGTAVLVGDRAGLDVALQQRLQRAGTYHVIAISGGNIALFSALVLGATRALTRRRRAGLLVAGLVLAAYAVVVGGGASVLRATGMALVGIAAQILDQRGAVLNVLALTAGALLAADPLLSVDVGFWLTTAATAGIMLGLPGSGGRVSRVWLWVRTLFLTSLWAELALLPIVAAVFQQVTLAGLVLSAVAIPGMAVAQMAAAGAVLADVVAPVTLPVFGAALRAGATLVTESARVVDLVPWAAWRVPPPGAPAIVIYYVVLAAWLWARQPARDTKIAERVRWVSALAVPALVVWVAVAPLSLVAWPPGELRLTVFDVGQGEAMLVEFPNGRRLLVDTGGVTADGRDLGERVVGPALRARGIRRLDYVLVTHADADHIGGAVSLVREFAPREVWTGIPVDGDTTTARLRLTADDSGATWRRVEAGDRLEIGQVGVQVLHPGPADWDRQRVRNDDSVNLALALGRVRLVLTGDIGEAVEPLVAAAASAASAGVAPPMLTVLKIGHHGSAGASSAPFLAAVAPAVALISVGAGNPFGHPAPATLARLASTGADVWRTDRDGEITVRTDGCTVAVSSFTGRQGWRPVQPR